MKIAATISRILLGLLFTVIGLNGFLNFIPSSMPANPVAAQFLTAVTVSHYLAVVFVVQIIGGVLLLWGCYIPLALTLLAAELVNILTYHITMDPGTIAPGLLATVLWVVVFARYRSSFDAILRPE